MIPRDLTNELLELDEEHKAEKEAREQQTLGEGIEDPPGKSTVKGLTEIFAGLKNFLQRSEASTWKCFHRYRAMPVLVTCKCIIYVYSEADQANYHGHVSEKRDTSSRTTSHGHSRSVQKKKSLASQKLAVPSLALPLMAFWGTA